MGKVKVTIDDAGVVQYMKTDPELRAALVEAAMPAVAANNQAADSYAQSHNKGKSGLRVPAYTVEARTLTNTQAAVIHSTNKIAAAIGRKHGLPHW